MLTPGESTARRAALEEAVYAEARSAVAEFLLDVERAATGTLTAGLLDHFTLGAITDRWKQVSTRVLTRVLRALRLDPNLSRAVNEHPYLAGTFDRIQHSDLPSMAYESARTVLAEAVTGQWDGRTTATALSKALDVTTSTAAQSSTGLTQHGMSWDALVRRIARTEATAVHNFSTLDRLAAEGYPDKRWVAHHDDATRDSHLAADGQTIPLVAAFIVGGEALMVPGDPGGSPAVSFNCRCVIVGAGDQRP